MGKIYPRCLYAKIVGDELNMNLSAKQPNKKPKDLHIIIVIIFLSAIINYTVFRTGGSKGSWTQLNFIPIILAAYYWKVKAGVLVAFILALIAGPLMPLDVSQGIMQTPANWIISMLIYTGIGFLSGFFFQKNSDINEQIRKKDLTNVFTGLYNTNKLFPELDKMIENNERFCLVFFKILNFQEISMYASENILKEITDNFIFEIKREYKGSGLYSRSENEFILVLKEYNENNLAEKILADIENTLGQAKIEGFSFNLIIKAGIVFYKGERIKVRELIDNARVSSNQNQKNESSVHVYNLEFKEEIKLNNSISGLLLDAINNNELYVVYQPIINLKDNSIFNVEALARWNRGDRKPIGPGTFIKIAEETGLIQKVTKEIIEKHINQLVKWKKDNIHIKSSVNITGDELTDSSFIRWLKELIDENYIDRSDLAIEITERVFPENGEKLNGILMHLQRKGYTVYLDDFGTGYNTLKSIEEYKADIIKIDKYFIDRIHEENTKSLIKHIIALLHEMGLSVVAEGVETREQFITLKAMGCDMIQGYYFSKPLRADDFIDYYKSFDMNRYL